MQPVEDDNMFVDRWNKNLGGKGKKLPGTKLTEMEIIGSGFRFTLELVPGHQTVSQVQGMVASLRGGLRLLPGQDIVIESHPTEPEPTALLTIITKSTVKTDQVWPGPELSFDAERGSVLMGPYIDGEGIARWSTYRKDGMFGGFIQGGIGSGKSRLIENIATALAGSNTHPTTIWFACGQGGASSPYLMKKATATATTAEQVYQMLLAAVAVMDVNGLENQANDSVGFFPTPQRPGLLIIIDEFHNFLDEAQLGELANKIQALMVKLAREARKAGVALLLATQEPLLAAFGHPRLADNLRSRLLEGNGVMMRSETNNAKQVFKVEVNARDFPDMPGYGFLARPAPGDRQAPFRGYYVNDEAIARWASSFTWRVLSKLQESAVAEDAGRWYIDRNKLADARQSENAARLARLRAGLSKPKEEREAQKVADQTGVRTTIGASFGDGMPGVDDVTKFWSSGPAAMHEPTAAERAALGDSHRKVMDAIRRGAATPTEIQEATGLAKTRTHELLKELTSMELIHKPTGYGSYALVH
jgi:predicted ATPase